MSKFDGLVWKKGAPGWEDIPAGIGYVSKDFDPVNDDASLRVEDKVKAGYGGKKVDFRNVNDLLTACPPEGTVSESNPPKVIYAAVHPTNLKAAIIVWSAPVVILDPSKISGGVGVSLNGRVMTIGITPVKIDGTDSQSINIQAGAVGAYGKINDPNQAVVSDTTGKMYAGSKNDTSVGDDQTSQSNGQEIPLFVPCAGETVSVSVSFTYKMEDAKQSCGEPHKIWGACYCIWGSTAPMEVFPFGTVMDLNPANLGPISSFYGGTVSSSQFVDRGDAFDIAVAGVAGPVIKVSSVNDTALPLQPGQVVSFQTYLCDTICGQAKKTKLHSLDQALAYVDEDIVKPKERVLPVYTFLETTYYMTTMFAITTTEIPAMTSTQFPTAGFTSVWLGTQVYGTAVQWNTDLKLPTGYVTQIRSIKDDPTHNEFVITEPPGVVSDYDPGFGAPNPGKFAMDPELVDVVKADGVSGRSFLANIADVVFDQFPPGSKALTGAQPPRAEVMQVRGSPFTARFVPDPGAVITAAEERISVTLNEYVVDKFPTLGVVITSIGSTTLTVCGPGGTSTLITLITSIGTAGPTTQAFSALSAVTSFSAVTHVPTGPPNTVYMTTYNDEPPIYAITDINSTNALPVTVASGTPFYFATTQVLVPTSSLIMTLGLVCPPIRSSSIPLRTSELVDVFVVTGSVAPPSIDLTGPTKLTDLTAFDPASADLLKVMAPEVGVTLTLPFLDKSKVIPILDVAGDPAKAVKLLISDTSGNLKLVGMTSKIRADVVSTTDRGQCTPGMPALGINSADYENDGEIRLLAPIPVNKPLGNAEDCPCFNAEDTEGGPSAPKDNSSTDGLHPCTLRVRRLQLLRCHK
jgi:hypothetical protein